MKILERSNRTHAIFQEARLLARVRHPNVVTVYRVEEFDGVAGIEMELVDGLTLKQVLEERGVFGAHETALDRHRSLPCRRCRAQGRADPSRHQSAERHA